jgi:hypothetical protein
MRHAIPLNGIKTFLRGENRDIRLQFWKELYVELHHRGGFPLHLQVCICFPVLHCFVQLLITSRVRGYGGSTPPHTLWFPVMLGHMFVCIVQGRGWGACEGGMLLYLSCVQSDVLLFYCFRWIDWEALRLGDDTKI